MTGPDSFRRVLRMALPWQANGFAVVVLAVGVPALLSFDVLAKWVAGLQVHLIASWFGLIGAAAFVYATWLVSRAQQAGHVSSWLGVAALLWSVEWLLRAAAVLGWFDSAGGDTARAVLAGAGGLMLSMGMLALVPPSNFRSVRTQWRSTRVLFGVQLGVFVLLPLFGLMLDRPLADWIGAREKLSSWARSLLWIAFAAPHVYLFLALRGTREAFTRRESISDILLR
ncbi:MAG: hypothetical protein K8S98_00815 [Planctomycetes bacterium]|nr:hypothetical protein [Planctomycetota bacterium]